jgi:hypothetical protein
VRKINAMKKLNYNLPEGGRNVVSDISLDEDETSDFHFSTEEDQPRKPGGPK